MLLITELQQETQAVEILDEATGKKDWSLKGIFMQAETLNRNGRVYPHKVLKEEINKYIKEYVNTKRSIGELNHPASPVVNPERASHLITSLSEDGNNFIGEAKILNTPQGNIVKGLLEGGVRMGVSSRGLGSIKEVNGTPTVQSDFCLKCVDIVADPSAPDAFVNGIFEGAEWVYQDGRLEQIIEQEKKKLEMKNSINRRYEAMVNILKGMN